MTTEALLRIRCVIRDLRDQLIAITYLSPVNSLPTTEIYIAYLYYFKAETDFEEILKIYCNILSGIVQCSNQYADFRG